MFLKCPHVLLLGRLDLIPATVSVELLKNLTLEKVEGHPRALP